MTWSLFLVSVRKNLSFLSTRSSPFSVCKIFVSHTNTATIRSLSVSEEREEEVKEDQEGGRRRDQGGEGKEKEWEGGRRE